MSFVEIVGLISAENTARLKGVSVDTEVLCPANRAAMSVPARSNEVVST